MTTVSTAPTPTPTLSSAIRSAWLFVVSALGLLGAVITTVVVVTTRGRDRFDIAVLRDVPAFRTAQLTTIAQVVTVLGSVPVVIGVALLATAALAYRTRSWVAPAVMLGATAATACTVFLLKIIIARPRPSLTTLIGTPSTDGSFPSGHTTDGSVVWVLAGVLLASIISRVVYRRVLVGAACGLAVAIGSSRIYLGYHWATDVLAGWTLAAFVLAASCLALQTLTAATLPGAPFRLVGVDTSHASERVELLRRRP